MAYVVQLPDGWVTFALAPAPPQVWPRPAVMVRPAAITELAVPGMGTTPTTSYVVQTRVTIAPVVERDAPSPFPAGMTGT